MNKDVTPTPKPWKCVHKPFYDDHGEGPVIENEDGIRLAEVQPQVPRVEYDKGNTDRTLAIWKLEAIQNAALMTAAPELLEALQYIINDCPEPGEDAQLTAKGYNIACEAIRKATSIPYEQED